LSFETQRRAFGSAFAVCSRFFNLEALPAKENQSKAARIGRRELDLARRWQREGLLSAAWLQAVDAAAE